MEMDHIYIFDYNNGRIYHDLIEHGKDYLEYYAEHNLSEDECNCMITQHAIYVEDMQRESADLSQFGHVGPAEYPRGKAFDV